MYKLILIDADDTLFDYKIAEDMAMTKMFEDIGYFNENDDEDYKKLREEYKEINSHLWKELEKGNIESSKLKVERFKILFDKLNLKYDPEVASKQYLKRLGEGSYLFEGAEDFCKYLSEKYVVVILTNGLKEVQIPRINNSKIAPYINELIISEEVGANKPDTKIFEYAVNKIENKLNIKINKDEIIMIGDSQSADIQGGINFGVDTCWVNIIGKEENKNIKATYNVKNYDEMYKII